MNPIGDEENIFANLFDQVPARRAGGEEDMAGAVLYLSSRAGVSILKLLLQVLQFVNGPFSHISMGYLSVSMAVESSLQMASSRITCKCRNLQYHASSQPLRERKFGGGG